MSRYEDDYHSRGRRSSHSHSRDRVRDWDYAPYADDRQSYERESDTRQAIASPGYTTYNGAPPSSHPRLTYEPHSSHPSLLVPDDDSHSHSRPRSLPPLIEYHQHRSSPRDSSNRRRQQQHQHQRGHSGSSSSASDRAQTPTGRAKHFVDSTFTDSRAGIGVGVLGALVGGLAAREAASKFGNNDNGNSGGGGGNGKGHRRHYSDAAEQAHRRNQILGAVVGAAVGALGANAVEKRLEREREKEKEKAEWERRWIKEAENVGRRKRERRSVSRSGGTERGEVIERRELVTRVRSRSREESSGGSAEDGGRRMMKMRGGGGAGSGRGIEREVDPGARSWKNVEDWLNDDSYCGGITDRGERESEEGRSMKRAGGGGSGSGSWSGR
ncbi:hypothetical protein F4775DRAFT_342866 [Biscogniauxia sp. FL1348]|nr:hypothetical protein F4775DRAFT_342866 [Biscogniauxia sp. FL1348]